MTEIIGGGDPPLYTEWLGVDHPYRIRCVAGRDCTPAPHNARPRLRTHRKAGYRRVEYLVTSLPEGVAPGTENAIRTALALAGEEPVHGREYFDISCLPLITDVAAGWLAGQGMAGA